MSTHIIAIEPPNPLNKPQNRGYNFATLNWITEKANFANDDLDSQPDLFLPNAVGDRSADVRGTLDRPSVRESHETKKVDPDSHAGWRIFIFTVLHAASRAGDDRTQTANRDS